MIGAQGGLRRRALLLVAIPLVGLFAAPAVVQTATAAKRQAIEQPDLLLRLHDLPPGYLNVELQESQGERTFCSRLNDPPDTPEALARFIDRFRPKGCVGAYYRLFVVPGQPAGPVLAGTGVLEMSDDRAADAAWRVVPQLLGRLFHDHPPLEVAVRAIASWRCTKTKTIGLPEGSATIYGGYEKNYRHCPGSGPRAFTARVYLGDLVIAVNPIPESPPGPPAPPRTRSSLKRATPTAPSRAWKP